MAIVALVLVALNTFIFSMGELWGRNSEVRLFDLHVRNVTRFLESELRVAALPPAGLATPEEAAIAAKEIRQQSGMTENLLTFELPRGSRLCSWPERALPDVVCSLAVRPREGLFLLWHSRLEKRFEDDSPREAVITPLATEINYLYYEPDFKNWKKERTLRKDNSGQMVAPQRIQLTFAYGGHTRESVVSLPVQSEGVPEL